MAYVLVLLLSMPAQLEPTTEVLFDVGQATFACGDANAWNVPGACSTKISNGKTVAVPLKANDERHTYFGTWSETVSVRGMALRTSIEVHRAPVGHGTDHDYGPPWNQSVRVCFGRNGSIPSCATSNLDSETDITLIPNDFIGVHLAVEREQSSQELLVGVLDDVSDEEGRIVVAFRKRKTGWTSGADAIGVPVSTHWTVAFDGRKQGEVLARGRGDFQVPLLAEEASLPWVGQRQQNSEFAGTTHKHVYRPLVVVSVPNVEDPDKWKGAPPTDDDRQSVVGLFAKRPEGLPVCSNRGTPAPWKPNLKHIKVRKTYTSSHRGKLHAVTMDGSLLSCKSDDASPQERWCFAAHDATHLRCLEDGLVPVDAGDYDGDGISEFVFFVHRKYRNQYDDEFNGYVLYWSSFEKFVFFESDNTR